MEEDPSNSTTETTILSALSTLTQPQLSHLTHSISSLLRRHFCRLSALLSSPTLFTLTLHHLHSISLPQKSLLLARHLLSTLSLLTHSLHPTTTNNNNAANLRHLDSTLLLLLLCEVRQHHPQALDTPPSQWLPSLSKYFSTTILSLSTLPISNNAILIQYIDLVAKCHRFVGVMGCGGGGEAAAAVAAVVGLPSVEVSGAARECVICKEEMREGRDVCELPCDHLFHWMCILPWLKKRNTCPCCRYRLPTDDVYGEIDRLWEVVVKVSRNKFIGESK
ncbi:E3 ubiquitin-protein ligase SGR9, amyloplastic [Actinidia eriantha]|uniref:E3 ubiquitin-protein ligase SGR9, amyloplastic n=1 Tax=Actinidia eriantha TaxID=165200 RepID=UPI00258D246C|nr:E3 ubiquitin-protein ligase SGR9, amyloplastic [Actinidia eriantha]